MRRLVAAIAVALAALPIPGVAADSSAEASFVARMNAERSARGLPLLQVHWDLVDDARRHSEAMRDADRLYHNPNLASVASGWEGLGENVGVGPTVDGLHHAFMASASHSGNILGDYNLVGVGVVVESTDKMWVTVVFMRGAAEDDPPLSPQAEELADDAATESGRGGAEAANPAQPRAVRSAPPPGHVRLGSSRWTPLPD